MCVTVMDCLARFIHCSLMGGQRVEPYFVDRCFVGRCFIGLLIFSVMLLSACDNPTNREASSSAASGESTSLVSVGPHDSESEVEEEEAISDNVLVEKLTVYSARQDHLIQPLFDRFTAETGIPVRFTTDKAPALIARLKAEGARSPADVLLTVDAGNLWQAADAGLLRGFHSPVIEANVPAHLRDAENRWVGLSLRARTIVYHTGKVKPEELSTYTALGDEAFKGRLCLRTSKKVYNQSLVAALIEHHGLAEAEKIVGRWVRNLATEVFSSDTQLIEAMVSGPCEVGVVNTYYLGRLLRENPDLPVAIFWPNQQGTGVHVNVSGGGILKYSPHAEMAQRFLEWLSAPEAQAEFAGANLEYPVNPSVPRNPLVAAWGDFHQDTIPVSRFGERQAEAVKLMDRVGYR